MTENDQNQRTTREDWIAVALDTLISEGVAAVKVLTLAAKLGVARSSFYWFFRSRQDLLDQLLDRWSQLNTDAIVSRTRALSATITKGVLDLFECWTDDNQFDPRLDFAVREWARRSGPVRRVLDQADDMRVAAISDMFRAHGYPENEAFIRARVLYFMQIGYYALELREPMKIRLELTQHYLLAFTGREAAPGEIEAFTARVLSAAPAGSG